MGIDAVAGAVAPGTAAKAARPGNVFGKIKGEKVQVHLQSPLAIFQNAAEELTFVVAEDMERKLSQRELKEERNKRSEKEKLGQEDMLLSVLSDTGNEEGSKKTLFELAEEVGRMNDATEGAVLNLVKGRYSDVSQQYASLVYVKKLLEKESVGEDKMNALSGAADTLLKERGEDIYAGINVTPVAQRFVAEKKVGNVQDLRDFYRDAVLDYGGIGDTFEKLVEQHGEANFPETLDFLLVGLGADLAAHEKSSIEPERLRAIVDDIQQIRLIGGLHKQCDELLHNLHNNYGAAKSDKAFTLLGEMIKLKESNWISGGQVLSVPKKMDLPGFDEKIYFLRGFASIIKSIPMKAYDGDYNKREKFVDGIQDAMNEMIASEEESFANEDGGGTV